MQGVLRGWKGSGLRSVVLLKRPASFQALEGASSTKQCAEVERNHFLQQVLPPGSADQGCLWAAFSGVPCPSTSTTPAARTACTPSATRAPPRPSNCHPWRTVVARRHVQDHQPSCLKGKNPGKPAWKLPVHTLAHVGAVPSMVAMCVQHAQRGQPARPGHRRRAGRR